MRSAIHSLSDVFRHAESISGCHSQEPNEIGHEAAMPLERDSKKVASRLAIGHETAMPIELGGHRQL
jgi:hypothetical protein